MNATAIDNAALFGVLASLADNKQALGWRYAYWSNGAPTLEAAVAAAAMTQDELGHARTLYPLLEQFAQGQAEPRQIEPMTRTLRYHVAALDGEFAGWCDFVATNFLLDTALTTFFQAAQEASYEPLRARARKIVQEERLHFMHAEGWVRRLAQAPGAVRPTLIAALARQWDETLCWFGPEDDPSMHRLVAEGVIAAMPDALRQGYLAAILPVLQSVAIALPVAQPLPWDRWHADSRRLEPADAG
jgi:phenylacetate-CoA oxygenase PaaI subunit